MYEASPHLRQLTRWVHHVIGVLETSGGRRLAACLAKAGGVTVLTPGVRAHAHRVWRHHTFAGAAGHDARAGPVGRCSFWPGRLGERAMPVLCASGPLSFNPLGFEFV
jgi:hypothetical protein